MYVCRICVCVYRSKNNRFMCSRSRCFRRFARLARLSRFFPLLPRGINVAFSVCICYRLFNLIYLRATDDLYRLNELTTIIRVTTTKAIIKRKPTRTTTVTAEIAGGTTLGQVARTLPLKWVTQLLSRLGHTPHRPL